jgi:hypothetical protein
MMQEAIQKFEDLLEKLLRYRPLVGCSSFVLRPKLCLNEPKQNGLLRQRLELQPPKNHRVESQLTEALLGSPNYSAMLHQDTSGIRM